MFQQEQLKQQLHQHQGMILQPQGHPQGLMMVQSMQHYQEPVLFQVDEQMQQQLYNIQQPPPQSLVIQPLNLVMVPHQQPMELLVFQQQQQKIFHQQQREQQERIFHQQQQLHHQHEMMFQQQQQQMLMYLQQSQHPQLKVVDEQKQFILQLVAEEQQQEKQKTQVKGSKAKRRRKSTAILSLPYPVDSGILSGDESFDEEIIPRPPYEYQSSPKATRSYSETAVLTAQTPQRKRSSYACILHSPQSESPAQLQSPPRPSLSPHYELHTPTNATNILKPRIQFLEPVTKIEYIHEENLQDIKTEDYSAYNPFHLHSKQILRRNLRCPVLNCSWSQRICGREELRKHHFKTHLNRGRIDSSIHPVAAELIAQLLYKCLVTGCGRIYSRGDSLKKHIKLVHEKPTSRFNKKIRTTILKGEDQGKQDLSNNLS